MFALEFPNTSHKQSYLSMMKEWRGFEATPTSPSRLFVGETYEEFLEVVTKDVTGNQNGVNSSMFFFMEGESIL
jgi:predicted acetyltransferase